MADRRYAPAVSIAGETALYLDLGRLLCCRDVDDSERTDAEERAG